MMDMIRIFNAETGKELQHDPEAISTEKEPTISWKIGKLASASFIQSLVFKVRDMCWFEYSP